MTWPTLGTSWGHWGAKVTLGPLGDPLGTPWGHFGDIGVTPQVIGGNEDPQGVVLKDLSPPPVAVALRVHPRAPRAMSVCLRLELYGCPWDGQCHPVSPHVTPWHPMAPNGTPCHPTSPRVTPCHPVSPNGTSCYPVSPRVTP